MRSRNLRAWRRRQISLGANSTIAVFGGTGFLGRRIVSHLLATGIRVRSVSRHPERTDQIFKDADQRLEARYADIHDDQAVKQALDGAAAVVNAVSLYAEAGGATFHSVHVAGAQRLATLCRERGIGQLVQISGIGADANSSSRYIRARGQGELAVRSEFPDAAIVRPAVMFGPDDAFLTTLVQLVRRMPVFPLFGRGRTRLQPVFVEDVARAVSVILSSPQDGAPPHELGGPRVYLYRHLVETVAEALGVRRVLLPVPFGAWKALAIAAERVPWVALTVNQVELMEIDNVAGGRSDLAQLGLPATSVEGVLPSLLETSP